MRNNFLALAWNSNLDDDAGDTRRRKAGRLLLRPAASARWLDKGSLGIDLGTYRESGQERRAPVDSFGEWQRLPRRARDVRRR